jgi:chromosome segregation ATPase
MAEGLDQNITVDSGVTVDPSAGNLIAEHSNGIYLTAVDSIADDRIVEPEQLSATREVTQLEFNWIAVEPAAQSSAVTSTVAELVSKAELAIATPQPEPVVPAPVSLDREPLYLREPTKHADFPEPAEQTERIRDLEQALAQCQLYIKELKLRLADQEFLEEILAKTEEASHVQQQAITTLRQQLARHEDLQTQVTQLQIDLDVAEASVQQQQTELDQLRAYAQQQQTLTLELEEQVAQKESQVQALRCQLTQAQDFATQQIEKLATVSAQVAQLETDLSDRQLAIDDLLIRLQRTKEVIAAQQEIISGLQQTQGADSGKNKVIQGLSKSLLTAQNKIEILETESGNQRLLHAQFQHQAQELEAKSIGNQKRANQLEQQVAEMQEQILHQAQQASEYETAVQHWKDRCLEAESGVAQLKTVLEQVLTDRGILDLDLLSPAEGETEEASPPTESESLKLLRGLKLDLPSFLYLRRNGVKS